MAAAVPLIGGIAATGAASAFGATAAVAMNIGMSVMTILTLMMAPRREAKQAKIPEVTYNPTSAVTPLPRLMGTSRVNLAIWWYGNFYGLNTNSDNAENKFY